MAGPETAAPLLPHPGIPGAAPSEGTDLEMYKNYEKMNIAG